MEPRIWMLVLAAFALTAVSRADLVAISGHTTNEASTGAFAGIAMGTPVRLEMDVTAPFDVISIDLPSFAVYQLPGRFTIGGQQWAAIDHIFLVIEDGIDGRDGIVPQITSWDNGTMYNLSFQILSSLDLVQDIRIIPRTMPLDLLTPMTDENIGFFWPDVNLDGAGTAWVATDYRWISGGSSVPESSTLTLAGVFALGLAVVGRVAQRRTKQPEFSSPAPGSDRSTE